MDQSKAKTGLKFREVTAPQAREWIVSGEGAWTEDDLKKLKVDNPVEYKRVLGVLRNHIKDFKG